MLGHLGTVCVNRIGMKYEIALRLWARKFNTAEIAAHLKEPEHIVQRWIWHWRELSREG